MTASPTWLTVITVVRDDPAGLARTAASLSREDLQGVEHVIVDGSTPPIDASEAPRSRIVRQQPRGVYAAMNAGLQAATGDYAWFLNAGDEVAAPGTLARVRPGLGSCAWAHAPVIIVGRDGRETLTPSWDYPAERSRLFARGSFPAHQGTFASTAALRSLGGFDEGYAICADYKVALQLSLLADPIVLGFPVARFREGGVSTTRWRASVGEFHRARREVMRPQGRAALLERLDTARQLAALGAYRLIVDRRRG